MMAEPDALNKQTGGFIASLAQLEFNDCNDCLRPQRVISAMRITLLKLKNYLSAH